MRLANSGIDDVCVDTGAGRTVRITSVQRQQRLVDSIETPASAGLCTRNRILLILLDESHALHSSELCSGTRRHVRREALERLRICMVETSTVLLQYRVRASSDICGRSIEHDDVFIV